MPISERRYQFTLEKVTKYLGFNMQYSIAVLKNMFRLTRV